MEPDAPMIHEAPGEDNDARLLFWFLPIISLKINSEKSVKSSVPKTRTCSAVLMSKQKRPGVSVSLFLSVVFVPRGETLP